MQITPVYVLIKIYLQRLLSPQLVFPHQPRCVSLNLNTEVSAFFFPTLDKCMQSTKGRVLIIFRPAIHLRWHFNLKGAYNFAPLWGYYHRRQHRICH